MSLRITTAATIFAALIFAFMAPAAIAHPGHQHGDDARIPGEPDFRRIGQMEFQFHPRARAYTYRPHPNAKPQWYHFDPVAGLGGFIDLPTSKEPVICATNGHRIKVAYSSTASPATPTTAEKEAILSIVQRMNYKVILESMRSSGNVKPLRMRVDCEANGQIRLHTFSSSSGSYPDVVAGAKSALGEPEEANSVKNLIFFDGSHPEGSGVGGIGGVYKDTLKSSSDASSGNDNRIKTTSAVIYNPPLLGPLGYWDTHATLHESFHTMGAVQPSAPFATTGLHCTDGIDVLCYPDAEGVKYTETRCPENGFYDTPNGVPLDCGYDTYFDAVEESGEWLKTNWNAGGTENPFLSVPQYALRDANSAGSANYAFALSLQQTNDRPVAGDWNGDGTDTTGFYRGGDFYLRNSNSSGPADLVFSFANPGDYPVAGDWNGDGIDTIGVYRPSTGDFFLRDKNSGGPAEYVFSFGNFNDVPLAGDWNGDGIDAIGVYRPSTRQFFLSNSNAPGPPDYAFDYGNSGDLPVAGDWAGDGADRIGLFRPSNQTWYLERYNLGPATTPEWVFSYGSSALRPIAGDWDNNGTDTPGAFE